MPEKMKIKKTYTELLDEYNTIPENERPTFEEWITDLVWHLRANTVLHTRLLGDLRDLHPDCFLALHLAKQLPDSGIQSFEDGPGKVRANIIQFLAGRGLIYSAGGRFWQLTHLGKMLMVESVGELEGIPL